MPQVSTSCRDVRAHEYRPAWSPLTREIGAGVIAYQAPGHLGTLRQRIDNTSHEHAAQLIVAPAKHVASYKHGCGGVYLGVTVRSNTRECFGVLRGFGDSFGASKAAFWSAASEADTPERVTAQPPCTSSTVIAACLLKPRRLRFSTATWLSTNTRTVPSATGSARAFMARITGLGQVSPNALSSITKDSPRVACACCLPAPLRAPRGHGRSAPYYYATNSCTPKLATYIARRGGAWRGHGASQQSAFLPSTRLRERLLLTAHQMDATRIKMHAQHVTPPGEAPRYPPPPG